MFDPSQKEPDDMFAQIEAPTVPKPQVVVDPTIGQPLPSAFPWKMVAMGVGLVAILVVAGGGTYWFLSAKSPVVPKPPSDVSLQEAIDMAKGKSTPTKPAEPTQPTTPAVVPEEPVLTPTPAVADEPDRDKDGLTDAQEAEIGTSPTSADTDNDGLFDAEELSLYKTSPVTADSDRDGYNDGTEVKNGYNPNGPGKLLNLPPRP